VVGSPTAVGSASLELVPDELGQALREFGTVLREQGDFVRATALFEQALALHRTIGDRTSVAFAMIGLGSERMKELPNLALIKIKRH